MYKPVDPKVDFPAMEKNILTFWKENRIFQKSLEERRDSPDYLFYDGPPFATGLPHFGHFVPGTIKDIYPRYFTMKGFRVERRFGWDCHGLPVEYEAEKELGISGKKQIEDYGITGFNEYCRSIVLRYAKEWEEIVTRLGRWVDFEHDYKTMEPDYMESIWWVVKQLWDKGLLYEGHYILPYCPRCSTVLSNHELNLGGYQEVTDPSVTIKFKAEGEGNTFFLAWTTTPWTLPSNLALTVGPDIDYVKVADGEENYILAKARLGAYYRDSGEYRILWEKKGAELVGLAYEPLFNYFAGEKAAGAFRIFAAPYVTIEDGTGIVHTAPGFGEDDYNTLKGTGISTVCPVDGECQFTDEVPDYRGRFVKDTDKDIIARLKAEGRLVKRENYLHSYPHCWRCSSPLIYRAVGSWFVNIGKIKQDMLAANSQINWVPAHLKAGRFGKWLEGARDWAISRNRYWGNPIPIWRCPRCGKLECMGSREELKQRSGESPGDLHKHFVDQITFPCSCGGQMQRVSEVLDCWFESGSMPYAQSHYPFENKEKFEAAFPADFIAEGLDQTRGWFYTLVILGAALFNKPAFKNVVVNGLVLAASGKKMAKRERNYSDPREVMEQFGADALRLFLMNSAAVRAEDLRYSDEGVKEVLKGFLIPLWNSYSFFVTYANIDNFRPGSPVEKPQNPLDIFILSEMEKTRGEFIEYIESYDIQRAIASLYRFVDNLNNWYIRRSRRRFWRSENDLDKNEAYQTLYEALQKLILLAAPIIPFVTEEIYQNLKAPGAPESIHLCPLPPEEPDRRNRELELKMEGTIKAVSLGRALRSLHGLKIRQPLKALHLVTMDEQEKKILREMQEIIKEELNVKEIIFRENEEELVEYRAKANFKALGQKLGENMRPAAQEIENLTSPEIRRLLEGSSLCLTLPTPETYTLGRRDREDGIQLELNRDQVIIERIEKDNLKVINQGSLTLALDSEITQDLYQEGLARDIVRSVQTLRKDLGLSVTDRISLYIAGSPPVRRAAEAFEEYIAGETLANRVLLESAPEPPAGEGFSEALVIDCG
ncbi:MAG: isoleucine--tRNA ligase, partial [Spirochaetales bacterium]|nr:isoleucine--tRNA ligase [Spirochaetales bacterium]